MPHPDSLHTFDCELCGRTFQSFSTEDEIRSETAGLYPDEVIPDEDLVSLCDSCYEKVRADILSRRQES
jgi:hypothetical protein